MQLHVTMVGIESKDNSESINWKKASGGSNAPGECPRLYRTLPKGTSVQYIKENDIPEELIHVLRGAYIHEDSGAPQDQPPDWFDEELFRLGQRVCQDYAFGIAFSQLLSLYAMFSFPGGLDPLISTGRSETPFAAFERYLSTATRVRSWSEGDPFDSKSETFKNLTHVRRAHEGVKKIMMTCPAEKLSILCTVGKDSQKPGAQNLWCTLIDSPPVQKEFSEIACPGIRIEIPPMSQGTMSFTQFSFFGMFLSKPRLFGAHDVSERPLEGLVHFWAVIGYCLGIQDRFNFCLGGMDVVRRRVHLTLQLLIKPQLLTASRQWEHMSRCATTGVRMYFPYSADFEVAFSYLLEEVLELKVQSVRNTLTWSQWVSLATLRFLLQTATKIVPYLCHTFNATLKSAEDQARNLSPEELDKLRGRTFSYMQA